MKSTFKSLLINLKSLITTSAILIFAVVILTGCVTGSNHTPLLKHVENDNGDFEPINTTPTYDITLICRWGDIDLGISYLVPLPSDAINAYNDFYGSWLFHNGALHQASSGDYISVMAGPASFEDIDTLFTDYYTYTNCKFGSLLSIEDTIITLKKNVLIGDKKAVYYEGCIDSAFSSGSNVAGYLVDFNGKLINVSIYRNNTKDSYAFNESIECATQMILSFEEYNGCAITELEDNEASNIDFLFRQTSTIETDNHIYTINTIRSYIAGYSHPYFLNSFGVPSAAALYSTDDRDVINSADHIEGLYNHTKDKSESYVRGRRHEIISSETVTIAGIDMNKDVILEYSTEIKADVPLHATVMYSFVSDGQFILLFDTETIYNTNEVESWNRYDTPSETEINYQIDFAVKNAEKIAGSIIRTITVK